MPFNLFGGMVSATANLLSGAAQRKHEKEQNEANLKAQKEENELNRQWQERMWQEHESPQAQVQNMKAAGLNPVGNVSSQSVGSASTSALPSAPPSQAPQFIARAGEAVANSLHAYKAMKLEERKQTSNEITAWQNHIRETIRLGMEREELEEQKKIWREELDNWKLSNHEKRLYNDWLDELDVKGINPTEINIRKTLADITHLETQDAFISAQTQTENELRAGKVTAQTLANMAATFEYELRKEFGHKMADLSYREFKEKVEKDEYLRNIYRALVQNEQTKAAYEAALAKMQYNDFITLPPWQRYMLQLGSHVVEKGAEFAF